MKGTVKQEMKGIIPAVNSRQACSLELLVTEMGIMETGMAMVAIILDHVIISF